MAEAEKRILTKRQLEREKERMIREHAPELLGKMLEAMKKRLDAGDSNVMHLTGKLLRVLDITPAIQIQNNNQILNATGGRGGGRSGSRSFESIVAALDSRHELERPASDVKVLEAAPQDAEFEDIPSASSDKAKATLGEGSGGGRIDPPSGREGGNVACSEEAG